MHGNVETLNSNRIIIILQRFSDFYGYFVYLAWDIFKFLANILKVFQVATQIM